MSEEALIRRREEAQRVRAGLGREGGTSFERQQAQQAQLQADARKAAALAFQTTTPFQQRQIEINVERVNIERGGLKMQQALLGQAQKRGDKRAEAAALKGIEKEEARLKGAGLGQRKPQSQVREEAIEELKAEGFTEETARQTFEELGGLTPPALQTDTSGIFEPLIDPDTGELRMPTEEEKAERAGDLGLDPVTLEPVDGAVPPFGPPTGNILIDQIPGPVLELVGVFVLAGVMSLALNIGRGRSVKPVR